MCEQECAGSLQANTEKTSNIRCEKYRTVCIIWFHLFKNTYANMPLYTLKLSKYSWKSTSSDQLSQGSGTGGVGWRSFTFLFFNIWTF